MITALIYSCSNLRNENISNINCVVELDSQTLAFSYRWKSDSLGCLKARTMRSSEQLFEAMNADSLNKVYFICIFGKANDSSVMGDTIVYRYFFDGLCDKSGLVDSFDYCIAEYIFINQKLLNREYTCN